MLILLARKVTFALKPELGLFGPVSLHDRRGNKVSKSACIAVYWNDVVGWRSGDLVWTVAGKVPVLSIGCPGVRAYAAADFFVDDTFPAARNTWAPEPANSQVRVLNSG